MPDAREKSETAGAPAVENHVDVLIIGAGISGIGSAYHLKQQCPEKSFAILERKGTFGGTWETHKYPGVRSDSDLYTFGYRFKPWTGPPIATASEILAYMNEVIVEADLDRHIHYNTSVTRCVWSSDEALWRVETRDETDDRMRVFTCAFLWMCQGYYDHDRPYIPAWPGRETYEGEFVHAQQWNSKIDVSGKKVLVIGSGATAATIIPAMADAAAHVTMLQRSPTYFFCSPNRNELADRLREVGIDEPTVHRVVRQQILHDQEVMTQRCRTEPDVVVEELQALIRAYGGADFPIEPHFVPRYRPWQQRLAFVPEGDIFRAAAEGRVSVVTDEIECFTRSGVRTKRGVDIAADLIVAATGFRLSVLGDIPFEVDGRKVRWNDTLTYRGMMFTGVPNMVWVFGYFRASWTLRVDLLGDFVCRLLRHMDAKGVRSVRVGLRQEDIDLPIRPWIDGDNFNPGYLMRALDQMPRSADKPEWRHNQDYWAEREDLPKIDLDGSEFQYG